MTLSTLVDRVQTIKETGSFKSACRAFEKAVEPFGACYYALGPLTPLRPDEVFAVAESPDNFAKHYVADGMFENDPLRRASSEGRGAFEWDEIKPLNDAEAETLRYVQSSGMRGGFATMTLGPGAMKLGVTMSWKEGGRLTPEQRLQADILSSAMLSHALYLNELSWRSALPVLCAQDIKILSLASNGFNDKRVAQQVGDNHDRVHERWRSIRRKLGAYDRAHAVAIAVSIGLIPPPSRAVDLVFGNYKGPDND